MKTFFTLLVIGVGLACHGQVLVNGGFEDPVPDDGWISSDSGPYVALDPVGWSGVGAVGVWSPSALVYASGVPQGSQIAYAGTSPNEFAENYLYQDTSMMLLAGVAYQLTASVGHRGDEFGGSGIVSLRTTSGALLVSSGVIAADSGNFEPVVVTYVAPDSSPHLGQLLRVQLELADGIQANFDGVALTVVPEAAVPVWSASLLIALTLLARIRGGSRLSAFRG